MRLKKIILENSIGLIRGSKLERIEIDFDNLEPSLIGLFGKSGTGKSTILNNINPYRANFGNDFYEDGYKELEFDFKGNNYVSKIYHKKALLFKNEILLNTSEKVSEYDTELIKEIGDEDTFYKLLYAGRRFTNVLNLTKGERKELIVDYLLVHLQKYNEYESILKQERDAELSKVAVYESKIQEFESNKVTAKETLKQSFIEKGKYEDIEDKIKELKEKQELFIIEKEKNKQTNTKIIEENNSLIRLRNDITDKEIEQENKKDKLNIIKVKYSKLKTEINEIKKVEYDKEVLDKELIHFETAIEYTQDEIIDSKQQLSKININQQNLNKEIISLTDKIKDLKLPCDSVLQIKCPLTEFKNVDKLIKQYESDIADKKTKVDLCIVDLEKEEKILEELYEKKEKLNKEYDEVEDKIKEYEESEKLNPKRELLEEYRLQGVELQIEVNKLKNDIEQLKIDEQEKIDNLKKLKEKILDDRIDFSQDIDEQQELLNESDAHLKFLEKVLLDAQEKLDKLEHYVLGIDDLKDKVLQYELLIEFFGKNGGQIFDIEEAGIEISKVANSLLENYQDKKLIVRFDTLKENKKGELKEVFDISVSINDGDWQTYLSDGETVLVSNAIREAMCYLNEKKDFKTVFIDEIDGSIDTENVVGFVKLLEEGNKLNERQFTFLISHNEEVKAYIEKNITLQNNKLILNL